MRRKPILSILCLFATLVCTGEPTFAQNGHKNPNPGVLPINARYAGLTYGEWSARWWQWFWATSTPDAPWLDDTGANAAVGQSGHVWFLTWHLTNPNPIRFVTVPAGKALMFTATNHDSFLDPLPPTASLDERRQAAEAIFDWIKVTGAEVDGVPIEDLTSYKAISPPYNVTLPPGNIFGFPAGEYGPTVSAGYYILLAPLSAGNHTIRFHFQFYYPPAGQVLNLDNIYHLTVLGD
jgi:hypothetical protein